VRSGFDIYDALGVFLLFKISILKSKRSPEQLVGLFKTATFCSMVSRSEDMYIHMTTIITSMKGFLTTFGLQNITGDQLVGLLKTNGFCSMVSRSEDMTTIITSMRGFLTVFRLQTITGEQLVGLANFVP
jgi:hypothetical protein